MTTGVKGAIAAGHAKTAEAGVEILQQGGNAFDAAIAAVLTACVVEPTLTSLGGGGFLLAHTQHGQDVLFDFFTQTPGHKKPLKDIDFYPVSVDFGSAAQDFHIGLGSMAVPGNVAGLFHVHQRLGRLPFRAIAEPAIHHAKAGVELGEFQAYCLKILRPILMGSAESRQIYAPNGELKQAGEQLVIPELADALSYLAEVGPTAFYEGEFAQQIARDCETAGGYLTLADLKAYRVIERQPLTADYRGNTLLTNPAPSSGGALIAFALKLLETIPLAELGFGSEAQVRSLATVMRLTNEARADRHTAHLHKNGASPVSTDGGFLSSENLAQYASQLALGRSPRQAVNKWGSTTHISAIDAEGNAASVTTSNGEGSSYIIPSTGIMLNNMLGEADLHPGGFHEWQEDVRISSMMAPTMLLRDHQPEIVLGSGGANRIRTAILQVICNVIDFQMSVSEAVSGPRIHWEDGVMNIEPGLLENASSALQDSITQRSHFPFNEELILWDSHNMFFGGVHTVMQDEAGNISGAGDFRRSGAVRLH